MATHHGRADRNPRSRNQAVNAKQNTNCQGPLELRSWTRVHLGAGSLYEEQIPSLIHLLWIKVWESSPLRFRLGIGNQKFLTAAVAFAGGASPRGSSKTYHFLSCLSTIIRLRSQSRKLGPVSLSFSRMERRERLFVLVTVFAIYTLKIGFNNCK
ncbi:hypothetical protein OSB04_031978 [Centaurea solstitialis]|uniref:Uncharacterized protein n=1 Tax=Centaurea solstitialis TaxID=347529 RepID=A0AA38SN59_9ASTR|nr:hypothetical protein OSB04_031978 [Centaurea solstitialis]